LEIIDDQASNYDYYLDKKIILGKVTHSLLGDLLLSGCFSLFAKKIISEIFQKNTERSKRLIKIYE